MKLKYDVFSSYRPACKYGSAGEDVIVIRDCGNVMIVQGMDGNRFPILIGSLTTDEVVIQKLALPNSEATQTITKVVQAPKKKAAPLNQQTLFL